MKVKAEFLYLGMESGTTRDNKQWTAIGLLQGLDSEKMYVQDEILKKVQVIQPMSKVIAELRINVNKDKTYINLDDIAPLK
jgi:hypothetical protein